ncbi:MAG TPA: O-methyltransferase [Bryobacteraceae bacterium]|nr:O-methyltransferase [Bryobacteraceae bacterium]
MAIQPVNEELLEKIDSYIDNLFVPPDPALEQNLADAQAAGLPAIAVAPAQGRMMYLLAKMAGAKRILEIGLLGGYSTTLFARALPENGKVISLELKQANADVARKNLDRAGIGNRVEIRVGPAGETLAKMIAAKEEPFDMVFIDADKTGYIGYLNQVLQLSHPGTVILSDNLIRHGAVLPDHANPDADARAITEFNKLIATHPRLESVLLPIVKGKIDGMAISIVK